MENQATPTTAAQPVVKTSELLALIKSGMSRTDINKKFGFNTATAKAVWSHPSLRNKRVPPPEQAVSISLVDDIPAPVKKAVVKKTTTDTAATATAEVAPAQALSPDNVPAPQDSFPLPSPDPVPATAPTPAQQPALPTPEPAMAGWGS